MTARSQCGQLVALADEKRIGADEECTNPLLDDGCESRLDFALGAVALVVGIIATVLAPQAPST